MMGLLAEKTGIFIVRGVHSPLPPSYTPVYTPSLPPTPLFKSVGFLGSIVLPGFRWQTEGRVSCGSVSKKVGQYAKPRRSGQYPAELHRLLDFKACIEFV
jgi:hypothetical protein